MPTPTLGFSSDDPPSTFECRYDAAAFAPCTGPVGTDKSADPLTDGSHSFEVRATDAVGNVDASPARRSFTVDTKVRGARIKAKAGQVQKGKAIKVKVKVGADEKVTATAKGTVKAKAAKGNSAALAKLKSLKLKAKPVSARAGKLAKVTLKAKAAGSDQLLKALGKGADASAKIKVKLTDGSGNVVTLKKSVRMLAG